METTKKQPEDIEKLKKLVDSLEKDNHQSRLEIDYLKERVQLLLAQIYGKKSEKMPPNAQQLALFGEEKAEEGIEGEVQSSEVAAHIRKKKGRSALPPHLPRKEILHDLSDNEKICPCGSHLSRIGEEVMEQLEYIPAKIEVLHHVRPKYTCKNCLGIESEQTILIAPPVSQIIPKSIASPELLAHVVTAKFVDAVPLYRQEKQFSRLGIELSRATMSNWVMKASEACQPLMALHHQEVLDSAALHIDETTLQVLHEPGRSVNTLSYIWALRSSQYDKPGVLFYYHENRSSEVVHHLLDGYQGGIQSDGYVVYDYLDKEPGIFHAGCMAHVRRKFVDLLKTLGKKKKTGTAHEVVQKIKKLYDIERKIKDQALSLEQVVQKRRLEAKPILDEIKSLITKKQSQTPPKGLLGKAISYALNQWDRLEVYIDHSCLSIDNNLVENAIRPLALGRKNWLFSNTPKGAAATALMFSLIETAKVNGLEPFQYLTYLFTKLPQINQENEEELKALLPQYLDSSDLSRLN